LGAFCHKGKLGFLKSVILHFLIPIPNMNNIKTKFTSLKRAIFQILGQKETGQNIENCLFYNILKILFLIRNYDANQFSIRFFKSQYPSV
jgi:hypothetical protein